MKSPVLRLLRRTIAPLGFAVASLCALAVVTAAEPLATLQAAPNRPFPQHVAYTRGSIKPNAVPQVSLDAATKSFYLAWRTKYLRAGCGPGRYYIYVAEGAVAGDPNIDPNTLTVSEAHGYGMMIFAWMAGYDPNAKAYFDGMVAYWKYFQLPAHPGLMAWKQVKGCLNAPQRAAASTGAISAAVGISDSASDGDLDIAYALLLADKQWGSTGAFNYKAEALKVIRAIYAYEINPKFHHIELGDWADPSVPLTYYATRPSDFMFDHLHAFKAATGDARWDTVITAAYQLVHRMQTLYSPATGLLPDFIININTAPRPPAGFLLESVDDGSFSYNACRTPWRLVMDYLLYGDPRALVTVNKINTWIRGKTGGDPALIINGYTLAGVPIGAGPDLPFVAPLGVAAMLHAGNQAWLNALWGAIVGAAVADGDYYGNTLKMQALIVMSGNAWKP